MKFLEMFALNKTLIFIKNKNVTLLKYEHKYQ